MVEAGISSDARPGRGHGPEKGASALYEPHGEATRAIRGQSKAPTDAVLRRHDRPGPRGYRYDVLVGGEVVCTSRDPQFAACRVLAERGVTGSIRFWREGKTTWDSMLDIERGAGMRTIDSDRGGLSFGKYTPPDERFKKLREGTESE
jgi:hypothetical protein